MVNRINARTEGLPLPYSESMLALLKCDVWFIII